MNSGEGEGSHNPNPNPMKMLPALGAMTGGPPYAETPERRSHCRRRLGPAGC